MNDINNYINEDINNVTEDVSLNNLEDLLEHPGLVDRLLNDDKMYDENGKAYQVSFKTSEGLKMILSLISGSSNHEKLKKAIKHLVEAEAASVTSAFADNIDVVEKCLDSIKSQIDAISKGLMSEEARFKAKYLDPMKAEIIGYAESACDMEEMKTQLDRLTNENEKLLNKVSKLEQVEDEYKTVVAEQKETINELTAESRDLMKANKDFNKTLEAAKSELNKKIDEHLNSIKTLEKEKDTLDIKLKQSAETEKGLREEIKTSRAAHIEEVNNINQTSLSVERDLNAKILELNVSINKLQSEKSSLESLNKSLNEKNETLKSSVDTSNSKIENMKSQVSSLTLEKKSLEVEIEGKNELIGSHNKSIENYLKDIKHLNDKLDGEIKLRQEKENKILQLEMKIADLEGKLKSTTKPAADKKTKK